MALPLRLIPFGLQRPVARKVLQNIFSEALQDGDFDFLQGRWLCIEITDLDLQWNFSADSKQHLLIENSTTRDATVSGGWKAFLELASRQTDPDTLFFQRKLTISGDTDLCHGVKNLLDSIELGKFGLALQRVLASFNALITPRRATPPTD